jgi:hypothetical protein
MLLRMRVGSGLFMTGLMAICACRSAPPRAPGAPVHGGDEVQVGAADAGTSQPPADDDGGPMADAGGPTADAGATFYSCERVNAARSTGASNTPTITTTTAPADFLVARQGVRWSTDCANPTLTLELSDGVCPLGSGHQLSIDLSVNAIEDGVIRLGENQLSPEAELAPIKVRYTRPNRLSQAGTWGTCDNVVGFISFSEPPELVAGANLQAFYQFTLTPCDSATRGTVDVVGTFKVQLRYALSEVCPNRVR